MAAQAVETSVQIAGIEELEIILQKYGELKTSLEAAQTSINVIFDYKYTQNIRKSQSARRAYNSIVQIIDDIDTNDYVTQRIDFDIIFSEDKIKNVIAHLEDFKQKWDTNISKDTVRITKKQADALKVRLQGRFGSQYTPLQKAIRQIDDVIQQYNEKKTQLERSLQNARGTGERAGALVRSWFDYGKSWGSSFLTKALETKPVSDVAADSKKDSQKAVAETKKRKAEEKEREEKNSKEKSSKRTRREVSLSLSSSSSSSSANNMSFDAKNFDESPTIIGALGYSGENARVIARRLNDLENKAMKEKLSREFNTESEFTNEEQDALYNELSAYGTIRVYGEDQNGHFTYRKEYAKGSEKESAARYVWRKKGENGFLYYKSEQSLFNAFVIEKRDEKKAAEKAAQAEQKKLDQLEKENKDLRRQILELNSKIEIAALKLTSQKSDFDNKLATQKSNYDTKMATQKSNFDTKLDSQKSKYETKLQELKDANSDRIKRLSRENDFLTSATASQTIEISKLKGELEHERKQYTDLERQYKNGKPYSPRGTPLKITAKTSRSPKKVNRRDSARSRTQRSVQYLESTDDPSTDDPSTDEKISARALEPSSSPLVGDDDDEGNRTADDDDYEIQSKKSQFSLFRSTSAEKQAALRAYNDLYEEIQGPPGTPNAGNTMDLTSNATSTVIKRPKTVSICI